MNVKSFLGVSFLFSVLCESSEPPVNIIPKMTKQVPKILGTPLGPKGSAAINTVHFEAAK